MALYLDGFAGDLAGLRGKVPYLQELGVNMVHIMPILECPPGASDGGTRSAISAISTPVPAASRSWSHWARTCATAANAADPGCGGQPHLGPARVGAARPRRGTALPGLLLCLRQPDIPDLFEETLPEIFPETAPGNFTFDEAMKKWVMTVFNRYQWDLNYSNPAVFIEMLDIILFWANKGR